MMVLMLLLLLLLMLMLPPEIVASRSILHRNQETKIKNEKLVFVFDDQTTFFLCPSTTTTATTTTTTTTATTMTTTTSTTSTTTKTEAAILWLLTLTKNGFVLKKLDQTKVWLAPNHFDHRHELERLFVNLTQTCKEPRALHWRNDSPPEISTEVAFLLITQRPWVQFLAFSKIYLVIFLNWSGMRKVGRGLIMYIKPGWYYKKSFFGQLQWHSWQRILLRHRRSAVQILPWEKYSLG